jgi:hypothetical protein
MKNKNAEIGWSFVVKLVLGIILLLALIFVALNAKKGFSGMFATLGNLFG